MQESARQPSALVTRLTEMITAINVFRIDLNRNGASTNDIYTFLNSLHTDFVMLALQLHSDRVNAARAKTIGNGVTRVEANLDTQRLCDLEPELAEIQAELLTLQMVLEGASVHVATPEFRL